jgi:hypothetical protein
VCELAGGPYFPEGFDPEKYATPQLPRVMAECGYTKEAIEFAGLLRKRCPNLKGVYSGIAEALITDMDWPHAQELLEVQQGIEPLTQAEFISLVFAISRTKSSEEVERFILTEYEKPGNEYKGLFGAVALLSVDRFGLGQAYQWCQLEERRNRANINTLKFNLIKNQMEGMWFDINDFQKTWAKKFNPIQAKITLSDLAVIDASKFMTTQAIEKIKVACSISEFRYFFDNLAQAEKFDIQSLHENIKDVYRNQPPNWGWKNGFLGLSILINQLRINSEIDLKEVDVRSRRFRRGGWHALILQGENRENAMVKG